MSGDAAWAATLQKAVHHGRHFLPGKLQALPCHRGNHPAPLR